MNHAKTSHQTYPMAAPTKMDRDTAIYWTKYSRQGLATAPATIIAILAGVSTSTDHKPG